MKDDPSISGKKTVEESVVESSWMWVDGVFQDGLDKSELLRKKSRLSNLINGFLFFKEKV